MIILWPVLVYKLYLQGPFAPRGADAHGRSYSCIAADIALPLASNAIRAPPPEGAVRLGCILVWPERWDIVFWLGGFGRLTAPWIQGPVIAEDYRAWFGPSPWRFRWPLVTCVKSETFQRGPSRPTLGIAAG